MLPGSKILAKVWLHKNLKKVIKKTLYSSKLAWLQTPFLEPWKGYLPPCFIPSVSPHISLQIIHDNISHKHNTTHPSTPHALQQSQRMMVMTMTVGRRCHGVVVAAPGCQGRPSMLPCCRRCCPTRRRVYRRPPERRTRHCGGCDGGAGAMGLPSDKEGRGRERHLTRRTGKASMPHAGP